MENKLVTKCHKGPRTWKDSLDKRPKLRKMDIRLWSMECKKSVWERFVHDNCERNIKI
jgi:hypothetical protein